MPYFDTDTVQGLTLRIHYEESMGVVSVTNIQLQTTKFGGGSNNAWYIGGDISVNDVALLTMSYRNPATHAFTVSGVGNTWINILPLGSSPKFPINSSRILDKAKVVISVDVTLWRDSSTSAHLSGSITIDLTTGFVYIGGKEPYFAYIGNGNNSSVDRYIAYIFNGTDWEIQLGGDV